MAKAVIIFPNQLFDKHPALSRDSRIFLVEDRRYLDDFHFHKKKLILHRASLQAYRDKLLAREYDVRYIEHQKNGSELDVFFQEVREGKIDTIMLADICDHDLDKRFRRLAKKNGTKVKSVDNPNYLTPVTSLSEFFRGAAHYSLTHFYIAQRKHLNILMDGERPAGGKWSFDPENRRKIPRGMQITRIMGPVPNNYVKEAIAYVSQYFPDNPGSVAPFLYPVTHEDAEKWLHEFFRLRFMHFGDYQDAIQRGQTFLFHSVISPLLNIGLLEPGRVVSEAVQYAEENRIPLHTVEGFIRQIIGWREFVRALYLLEGQRQRTTNFWNHQRKIPASFYDATSGIEPLDDAIRRLLEHGYLHHIERLMVVGNFMLLCGIAPDEIYRWFMELFVDAYDWVMVPNVYGLSQYSDGGLMTTKPYCSSSHYIKKMSDYPEGEWCAIWDALFWSFIDRQREFFSKNPRLRVMVHQLNKKGKRTLHDHARVAKEFIERLWGHG